MNKELTKEEAEEFYNKLWLENKELIQENMGKINTERFELEMELIDKNKEIERLNKLISQREKKWEKWTTEKTILSTKMSDYLCKYQNIKREYTKQIKISTDRKKEIERLNNIIKYLEQYFSEREYYEFAQLVRETKQANIEWLKNAIKEEK